MNREGDVVQRLRVRDGYFRDESGKPVYLIGANFWPKRTGPWMYRDPWDPRAVGADLAELGALGANTVRIFCFTPDFMPAPDVVSEQALKRLEACIELAAQAGLWSIPTFLVGHMSGENWETDWSGGRDWYSDPLLLDASELLIGTIASHFARDPRIAAWLLTNEWPLFAGNTSNEQGLRWAKRLSAVLRAADPDCNLSLGDGAWDVVNGQQTGLAALALREVVDFFGPHFYPKETDSLRHSAFASYAMRMLQPLGRPILLEEFGCSSDQADDEFAADYYRTVLWSGFGAGNCGALFWNSHDFTLNDRPPYLHHPYELHFGVIRTDGSMKPQAAEVRRFAQFTASHKHDEWEAMPHGVAIGRTSYYLESYPFNWGWARTELRDLYLLTYTNCMMAGIDAGFVDLASTASNRAQLIIVPCLQQVTTNDAEQLERFAQGGGTVYLSYGGEPWFPNLAAFTGTRLLIRYGLIVAPPEETLRLRFEHDFGDITKGSALQFAVRGDVRRRAPLWCEPREAAVIATTEDGNSALLERRLGSGRIIFMAYPLEYYALTGLESNAKGDLWRFYRALGAATNTLPSVRAAHPHVQFFVWRSKKTPQRRLLLLINHDWGDAEMQILGASGQLRDVESNEEVRAEHISIGKKGVRLLEFTTAG